MTAPLLVFTSIGGRHTWPDRTIGEAARLVRNRLKGAIDPDRSVAFGAKRWELEEACSEASVANWDGYGARAVDGTTYERARAFLEALPINLQAPEIAIDPDGEVSFRWQRAIGEVLSVSVSGESRLSYAALFGEEDTYGTTYFHGEIPPTVSAALARLFP